VLEERSVYQAALDTASTEANLLEDTTKRSLQQLEKSEKELANLDSHQADKTAALEEATEELSSSKARLGEAKQEEADLAKKEQSLQKKHAEYTARSEEAKAALQSGGHRSDAVKGILKAAKKGGELASAGIKGRLGDLASISEEYDVAISTACGALDNIVVESTAGAQMCLKFLRKHGLGRANFTPLDKMKKGAHLQPVATPEDAPRLFDVISVSETIAPALFLYVRAKRAQRRCPSAEKARSASGGQARSASTKKMLVCGGSGSQEGLGGGAIEWSEQMALFCGESGQAVGLSGGDPPTPPRRPRVHTGSLRSRRKRVTRGCQGETSRTPPCGRGCFVRTCATIHALHSQR
jgi:structural maintenance of chromosome 4